MFILIITKDEFISHDLIILLLKKGHKIRFVYTNKNLSYTRLNIINNIEFIYGNVFDCNFLRDVMIDIDYVYHNYSYGFPLFTNKDNKYIFQCNIQSTKNIVNASLKSNIKKLIYISSAYSMGYIKKNNTYYASESYSTHNIYDNMCSYAKSLYLSECEIWRGIAEGLDAIIINPTNIITSNCYPNIINILYYHLKQKIYLYNSYYYNGYIGLKDLVIILIKLMESSICNEKFIINAENIKLKDMFSFISQHNNIEYNSVKQSNIKDIFHFFLNKSEKFKPLDMLSKRNIIFNNTKIRQAIDIKFHSIKDIILRPNA